MSSNQVSSRNQNRPFFQQAAVNATRVYLYGSLEMRSDETKLEPSQGPIVGFEQIARFARYRAREGAGQHDLPCL
jgi:hypothetical protein